MAKAPEPKAADIKNDEAETNETGTDNGVAPATSIDASGAPVQIVPDVDMAHPAVDADPRKNTTVDQNRIDFNDPSLDEPEAVAKNLANSAPKE